MSAMSARPPESPVITPADRHRPYADQGHLRIAVTGATGLVGSELVPFLRAGGHAATRIVRRDARGDDIAWDPAARSVDVARLEGLDAVVHLAGENVAQRWTAEQKARIRSSRVDTTRFLALALAGRGQRPRVLVVASAIGIYGGRGDELLDESSSPGTDFLARVARDWESAADPAREAGIRVVHLRFGVILTPKGGALAKMLPIFRLRAGARIGSGRQWMSWIGLADAVAAVHFAIMRDTLAGPVNVVAPRPVTNAQFTETLARVVDRPLIAPPVPAFALKLMYGEMAEATVLASQRVMPARLERAGFAWGTPGLEEALREEMGLLGTR